MHLGIVRLARHRGMRAVASPASSLAGGLRLGGARTAPRGTPVVSRQGLEGGSVRPIDRVLESLQDPTAHNGYFKALCPTHEDREPSLSVSEADDRRVDYSNTDIAEPVSGMHREISYSGVQQPCNNPSKSPETLRNALTQKYGYLQAFCKLWK